ncbi:MAG: molybdopterin-dependent oxidoreductase [Methanomicrobiaceae archaeon]|nr:molybdopterin-dependent oxidoreductase [Methanomicrobiaceae archaeon]
MITWRRCCIPALSVFFVCTLCLLCGCVSEPADERADPIRGDLTVAEMINGTETQSVVLSYDEVLAMPAYTAHGYAVSTVGIKFGPYVCTGVALPDLLEVVGGAEEGDQVYVSAPDGYLWVFDYDQLHGESFITLDENLREIPSPPLTVILMYEQDGAPLSYNDGAPFRVAITSAEEGVITEGSSWVKWVDRIEVHRQ